ncbi:MAG: nitroreductase family protein [bacterium]|nr:nitroreductase family protein [bacterium]
MDVIQAIKERRSINFFETGQELPDEQLRELVEISNLAPSSFNLQPWKLIVVRNPESKRILRRCAFNQRKIEEAAAVFIIVADPGGVEENLERVLDNWEELGYMKPEARQGYVDMIQNLYGQPNSLKRKFFAIKNASLFAMNLMIAAKGFGLDTHPMDGFDEDSIKREFDIPPDKVIPMIIAVGHLKKGTTLLPRAFRRRFEEFVRLGSY